MASFPVPPPLNVPAMLLIWLLRLAQFVRRAAVDVGRWLRWRVWGAAGRGEPPPSLKGLSKGAAWLSALCGNAARRGDRAIEPQQISHYPPQLHLQDFQIESLLAKAREKFQKKKEFNEWRMQQSTRARFESIDTAMRQHFERMQDAIAQIPPAKSGTATSTSAEEGRVATAALSPVGAQPPQSRSRWDFDDIDTNRDGVISQDELQAALQRGLPVPTRGLGASPSRPSPPLPSAPRQRSPQAAIGGTSPPRPSTLVPPWQGPQTAPSPVALPTGRARRPRSHHSNSTSNQQRMNQRSTPVLLRDGKLPPAPHVNL